MAGPFQFLRQAVWTCVLVCERGWGCSKCLPCHDCVMAQMQHSVNGLLLSQQLPERTLGPLLVTRGAGAAFPSAILCLCPLESRWGAAWGTRQNAPAPAGLWPILEPMPGAGRRS